MPSRLLTTSVLAALTCLAPASAQAREQPASKAIEILRQQGLEHSQVMEILSWICDVHGPRLTGSPNIRRAQAWAAKTLESWGLDNVHLEPWGPFGRGWQLGHFDMEVIGDNTWPVLAWPKAWSGSLDGRVIADVVNVARLSADELAAMDLSDKIVMVEKPREVSEPFDAPADRLDATRLRSMAADPRPAGDRRRRSSFRRGFRRSRAVLQAVFAKHPIAILDRSSKGDYGTVFVQGASVANPPGTPREERRSPRDRGVEVIPQITVAVEHYNRICRLLDKNLPVRMAIELDATYTEDDPMEHNVIGEISGADPVIGDEIVMIGAHFDSWHSGTGATDNGAGSAVMMEAMRLLTVLIDATGETPRRTIRIGLWSGEEQGLLGSRAHVSQHYRERGATETLPDYDKFAGYYNYDNGTGRIRGIYLQGNEAVAPIFREWLRPFHDLDATTLTLDNTGGTDHLSFDGVGLPGFQFIQDPVAYNTRTHHSNMDNWDHALTEDLRQAATIVAAFAWQTAQRDEKLPRKPATPQQRRDR